jgi:hypothetical protein
MRNSSTFSDATRVAAAVYDVENSARFAVFFLAGLSSVQDFCGE